MREICISLDLKTGKRQWSTHLGIMDYKAGGGNSGASDNKGGDGPRSTPSVLDGKVWAYDSDMSLHCLSARNGKLIWRINILKEHGNVAGVTFGSLLAAENETAVSKYISHLFAKMFRLPPLLLVLSFYDPHAACAGVRVHAPRDAVATLRGRSRLHSVAQGGPDPYRDAGKPRGARAALRAPNAPTRLFEFQYQILQILFI